ncbi:MAG: hypothetical protein KH972_08020 [Peptostreptococcaceae bacterium]|nr:hypothetical protein [Peptostreptococcaceae bacterium]
MHDKLVRIQKGYILIDRAKQHIDMLAKCKDIVDGRKKLDNLKKEQESIRLSINELKNRIVKSQEKLKDSEVELNKIIKYIYSNSRKRVETLTQKNERKEEILKQRQVLEKEVMDLFIMVDSLKDKMNHQKLIYNDEEKEYLRVITNQNHKIVKFEEKISSTEKSIRRIRKSIDSEVLSIYDKKRQKNIMVMSRIEDGKCYNCGQEISDEDIEKVGDGEIMECPNCERILYILQEEPDLPQEELAQVKCKED